MRLTLIALATALTLSGCSPAQNSTTNNNNSSLSQTEIVAAESARLNAWFEEKYEAEVLTSPIQLTMLGRTERQGEIDDFSEYAIAESLARTKTNLIQLTKQFDYEKLTPEAQLSYDIWVYQAGRELASDKFKLNSYVFDQMSAVHTFFPQLLISFHKVETVQDLDNYISRITGSAQALEQLISLSKKVVENDVRPPYFAFDMVINEAQKIITGAPFTAAEDSDLWADAKNKVANLVATEVLSQAQADEYLAIISKAFTSELQPAYQNLIAWQEEDKVNASPEATGVSALPNGKAYYEERLMNQTTTQLTAEEIHTIGLDEVARLKTAMEQVKDEFGFTGSLAEFFVFLRDNKDDERLYYPNTDAGRQGYIDDATAAIDKIKAVLPDFFGILPKADMVVKRVEAFREQPGAAQHYFPSTPDGSRPGVYYAHLSDMTAMPKRELEVIAYHEGLPGHHMQIAIQQELSGVPTFRTQAGFTAYVEGWALYSEWLATEIEGTYADPLSEFGRLGSEIWRAIRLVVDTGLHAKGWTEQEAIDYFMANSAITETQARSEVRRYLVLPGQATSYKIGMLRIQEMRADAEAALGDNFSIKGFHDVVLGGGAMPLDILEKQVAKWVQSQL